MIEELVTLRGSGTTCDPEPRFTRCRETAKVLREDAGQAAGSAPGVAVGAFAATAAWPRVAQQSSSRIRTSCAPPGVRDVRYREAVTIEIGLPGAGWRRSGPGSRTSPVMTWRYGKADPRRFHRPGAVTERRPATSPCRPLCANPARHGSGRGGSPSHAMWEIDGDRIPEMNTTYFREGDFAG
jgi:hypothetical protein